jgi:hypothetical protein
MKDIKGYEDLYAITMTGRVWSYRRKKFLKPNKRKDGYLQVTLCKNGNQKNFQIHRLVAETYIPNPDGKSCVGHIDDDKTNNCWDNLYWTTVFNNNNYGKRAKSKCGAKKVICIETGQVFRTLSEAANEMNLNVGNICSVCHGRGKACGGYHFEYVKE